MDASIKITVTEEGQQALLSITATEDDATVSFEQIQAALQANGVTTGIDEAAIHKALEASVVENVVVAQAVAAQTGQAGCLQPLIEQPEGEDTFSVVDVDTPLLRCLPPSEGEPGKTVLGDAIPGLLGAPATLPKPKEGVGVSSQQTDTLVATRRGIPVFANNNVEVTTPIAITLQYNEESRRVVATAALGAKATTNSDMWLKQTLGEAGYADFFLLDEGIKTLLEQAKNGEEATHDVAEKRDGSYVLAFSDDNVELSVSITQPQGGRAVKGQDILSDLSGQGVTFGVLKEAIEAAVSADTTESVLIAQGVAFVAGEDAIFEPLFQTESEKKPKIDDAGNADFKNLQEFLCVEPGQPLMRRIPATAGKTGKDVFARDILATPGENHDFAAGLEGVVISKTDPNVLEAATKGHPSVVDKGVRVDEILPLDIVNITVGNVDFDGAVQVKNDVHPGLTIKASGDVLINGLASGCIIESGGSIIVNNGIIGGDRKNEKEAERDEKGESIVRNAHLICDGDVVARYIDNVRVEAKGTVSVREYIMHSKITRAETVSIGQDGGKGQLIGGETHANCAVLCNILGSVSSTPTVCQVGLDSATCEEYEQILNDLNHHRTRHKDFSATTQKIEGRKETTTLSTELEDLLDKAKTALQDLESVITSLTEEKKAITARLEAAKEAHVTVAKQCFEPSSVTINGKVYRVREETKGGTFRLKGKTVEFE